MKDYKNLFIFLVPYLTLSGALYHIAFWNEFDFNGLQFVDLIDLFKIAAPSIFPPFIFAIIISVINSYMSPTGHILEPGGGRNTKVGKFVNRYWVSYLLLLVWVSIITWMVFNSTNPHRWISVTYIFVIPFSVVLTSNSFVIEVVPDFRMRNLVVLCLLYIPTLCYARAKEEAENILQSIEYKYTTHVVSISGVSKTDTLKYLALKDDKMIFTDKTNKNIIFIKASDTTILKFKKHDTTYRGFVSAVKSMFSKKY